MDFTNQVILFIGLIFLVSILASVVSARLGAPLLLVFLVLGMLLGEEGLGIRFDDVQTAHLIGSLALAVILFDGGLRTSTSSFRVGLKPAVSLASVGVLITATITGLFAAWLLDLHWIYGLLMGAIVGSTDAAAVFSLLHTSKLELKQRVGATLEIESGSNDPMAIFLTLVMVELIVSGEKQLTWLVSVEFVQQMGLGALIGLGGAWLASRTINALTLTVGLYPLMALAAGLLIFGLAAMVGGSGFLAVYLAGVLLGNSRVQSVQNIRRFHDGMAWISQIVMFLMLGILVTPSELLPVGPEALVVALVLMFIARPVAVLVSLIPFRFDFREQLFISWVGLRGAVPIILAIFPLLAGIPEAQTFFNVAFFVVLISLVVQGWSLVPAARLMGVQIPANTHMVQRMELDLPGQPDYEMVGYQVDADSSVEGRSPERLVLPNGVKTILIIREGELLTPREVSKLQTDDAVYLVAPFKHLEVLDRLFVSRRAPQVQADKRFFGEFTLNGSAHMADLGTMYGFELPDDSAETTAAEFLQARFGKPVVGDRVRIGPVELVIRKMDGDTPDKIGLKLIQE
ncbi:cell volume regulation protein A [Natronospira proteinivora]|uniref:Cell volume regulation protein A n=1 Tax=Natronospira proteinivora TaxID=1807133 RepID=A0ABT1G9E5_9GAMM|nr:potassium/proton antiporter [Natronospira proteinivora]MCP1727525.1 cell volume regulation protein A [Natronospira proteinivora]